MEQSSNLAVLCGTVNAPPAFSHSARGESFYTFALEVQRLSGASDVLNVTARQALLERMELQPRNLQVVGEVRSFNNRSGQGSRLVISVFARELEYTDEEPENRVWLRGTICKAPTLRRTPMGRMICDVMLAVNRRWGRADYLPCIAWGSLARQVSERSVGEQLSLEGRIQSRRYVKKTETDAVEKTAYEVSVVHIEQNGFTNTPSRHIL